jgi:hypothetical protein
LMFWLSLTGAPATVVSFLSFFFIDFSLKTVVTSLKESIGDNGSCTSWMLIGGAG